MGGVRRWFLYTPENKRQPIETQGKTYKLRQFITILDITITHRKYTFSQET